MLCSFKVNKGYLSFTLIWVQSYRTKQPVLNEILARFAESSNGKPCDSLATLIGIVTGINLRC
jgi:hypothetical protein